MLAFGNLPALDFQARIMAAKTGNTARLGCILGAFISWIVGITFSYTSGAARALYGPSSPYAEFVADSCSADITVIGCFGGGGSCGATVLPGVPTCGEWKPDPMAPLLCSPARRRSAITSSTLTAPALVGTPPGWFLPYVAIHRRLDPRLHRRRVDVHRRWRDPRDVDRLLSQRPPQAAIPVVQGGQEPPHHGAPLDDDLGAPRHPDCRLVARPDRLLSSSSPSTLCSRAASSPCLRPSTGRAASRSPHLLRCLAARSCASSSSSRSPRTAFSSLSESTRARSASGSYGGLNVETGLPLDGWCPQYMLKDFTGIDSLAAPFFSLILLFVCQILPTPKHWLFEKVEPPEEEKEGIEMSTTADA